MLHLREKLLIFAKYQCKHFLSMKTTLIALLFIASMATHTAYAENTCAQVSSPELLAPNGGTIEYRGTIGSYKVEFTFMRLHMGRGDELYYKYTTINVNNGEPIELVYKREQGRYSVYYEYINGKHTGTFSIIRTKQKITGTFRNSKGQTYKVNAVAYGGNWADE